MRLNRLTCLLVAILTLTIQSLKADPLQTHDQYLRHYETGFYSGLGAEISPEADAEKSERDDIFVNEESKAIPDRYAQLGLNAIEQLDNLKIRRWSYGDRQSLVIRTRSRGSFLIVFNKPIRRKNLEIDLEMKDRTLKSGETKACLVSEMVNMRMRVDRSSRPMTGVRNCHLRVEAIYPLKDMEEEKRVIKFLRANN